MKLLHRFIYLAFTVLALPSSACADTVTLVPSRDTTIYQGSPSNSNGAGLTMFVGTTGRGDATRALIGFDIAGKLPAGSTVTSVQLTLVLDRAASRDTSTRPIELHRLLADWGEGTAGQGMSGPHSAPGFATAADGSAATWSHPFYDTTPWANAGGDFMPTASGTATVGTTAQAYVWDSTPALVNDVQSWLDNPASNFGWLLLGDESTSATARRFFTREASDPTTAPALAVTFTPPNVATTQLVISVPASTTAGSPFDVTVTAMDNSGNVLTGYTGTVTFTSTDPHPGVLPTDYTFTAADQGTHTFSGGVTLFTAGAQTLTVQDTANTSFTGSATIAVTAAPADHLLVTAPSTVVAGTPFDVTLSALDPYGNVDPNYSGTVTWTSSDTDPGVVLPAAYTFQPTDTGTHPFPAGVTLITAGDQTLTATDTATGLTGSVTVTVGGGS